MHFHNVVRHFIASSEILFCAVSGINVFHRTLHNLSSDQVWLATDFPIDMEQFLPAT